MLPILFSDYSSRATVKHESMKVRGAAINTIDHPLGCGHDKSKDNDCNIAMWSNCYGLPRCESAYTSK